MILFAACDIVPPPPLFACACHGMICTPPGVLGGAPPPLSAGGNEAIFVARVKQICKQSISV